jgi:hypothetical protein
MMVASHVLPATRQRALLTSLTAQVNAIAKNTMQSKVNIVFKYVETESYLPPIQASAMMVIFLMVMGARLLVRWKNYIPALALVVL